MEERVRFCPKCSAVVGWFAVFCENCGSRQESAQTATAVAAPRSGPPAIESAREPARPVEAREFSRDLFRAQLRLIHRYRELGEALGSDVARIRRDLEALEKRRPGSELRAAFDSLSERVLDAEHRWEEQQRSYNRESEHFEEECREHLEAAQIDAYVNPDEQDALELEYGALGQRLEAIDGDLRAAGREIAFGRKRSRSNYFGMSATSGRVTGVLGLASVGLLGWSAYLAQGAASPGPSDVARILGPAAAAIFLWAALAFARR